MYGLDEVGMGRLTEWAMIRGDAERQGTLLGKRE